MTNNEYIEMLEKQFNSSRAVLAELLGPNIMFWFTKYELTAGGYAVRLLANSFHYDRFFDRNGNYIAPDLTDKVIADQLAFDCAFLGVGEWQANSADIKHKRTRLGIHCNILCWASVRLAIAHKQKQEQEELCPLSAIPFSC